MKAQLIKQFEAALVTLRKLDGEIIAVSDGELLSSLMDVVMTELKGDMSHNASDVVYTAQVPMPKLR